MSNYFLLISDVPPNNINIPKSKIAIAITPKTQSSVVLGSIS
ncbi:hypothetical protein CWATWH0402_3917 [Crocosphaera watsonii WH 0402]|uniref:Uncharacterized protein n=2 Tax=Crocosphaera watsonii TaxID=263511 RepID=T2K0V9_CROWT|nr:hypothetical protein CWATWH0005_1112 [Crocosphaera watsonii WH 0005]CCQ70862.1 hypothetical protein CWATWH0402_3917 [Crocosphaera watsonii WH 0402]